MGITATKKDSQDLIGFYEEAYTELSTYNLDLVKGSPIKLCKMGTPEKWRVRKGPKDFGFVDKSTPRLLKLVNKIDSLDRGIKTCTFRDSSVLGCVLDTDEPFGNPLKIVCSVGSQNLAYNTDDVLECLYRYKIRREHVRLKFAEHLWKSGCATETLDKRFNTGTNKFKVVSETNEYVACQFYDRMGNKFSIKIIF